MTHELGPITLILVVLASLLGCGEEITKYIDPEVTFAEGNDYEPVGEISLTIGLYREQFFTGLSEGDDIDIINGFQGGTWVMPAIQCTGFALDVQISGSIVIDETGENVGVLHAEQLRLDQNPEGSLEANAIAIPILHEVDAGRSIDDLYGERATLTITIADDLGNETTESLSLVLVDG